MKHLPEISTREEVANYLRVSTPTVTYAVRKLGLPAIRFGRVYRFRREDVLAWQATQTKAER